MTNLIIHPGEILKDILDTKNISIEELINNTGVDKTLILSVIDGKEDISNNIASSLESYLDIPKSFWINLENNYKEEVNRNG